MSEKDNHITARVDPNMKQAAIEHAEKIERHKTWVYAKAFELGLPEVLKRYPAPKSAKTRAA